MLNDVIERYNAFPNSVKNGVLFLFSGWIGHGMVLTNFLQVAMPTRQIFVGLSLFFLVLMMTKKRGWARWLCILSNAFLILQYILPIYLFFVSGKLRLGLFSVITLLFLSASTYYLTIRESSDYFKKDEGDADSSDKDTIQNQN